MILAVSMLIAVLGGKCNHGAPVSVVRLALDRPMNVSVVSESPLIRVVEDFISPEEATYLIQRYSELLARSPVISPEGGGKTEIHPARTSFTAFLPAGNEETDPLLLEIERRAVALSGKPHSHMETLQLVRYEPPSQTYSAHFDYFLEKDVPSQRTTSIFVYLNDTQGEAPTRFPRLNLDVVPKTGKACTWENCYARGSGIHCDDRTQHAGEPPSTATKYGLNIWFRTMPFR